MLEQSGIVTHHAVVRRRAGWLVALLASTALVAVPPALVPFGMGSIAQAAGAGGSANGGTGGGAGGATNLTSQGGAGGSAEAGIVAAATAAAPAQLRAQRAGNAAVL